MLQSLTFELPCFLIWAYISLGSLGVLTAYWCLWIIYARHLHPLSRYPGPFLASVSRSWLAIQIAGAKADKVQRKLHHDLGPIVRIAPNEVAISDPGAIKTIYSINSGFTKTDFYLPFRPGWSKYPDSFTCLDERLHASRRKIVNNLYSMSNILRAETSVDTCTNMFMLKMKLFAETDQKLDISKWIQMYAFDVIGQLCFSRMFGFLAKGGDHNGYISSLDSLLPALAISCALPSYMRQPLFFVGGFIPSVSKALESLKHIETAAETSVAEREKAREKENHDPKRDILSMLFDIIREKGDKVDFGSNQVKVEVYVALFAGSDTTAAAVSSILYFLIKNPPAYRKLTKEIRQGAESGVLSVPYVRFSEAKNLPYLDACCKEGMRIHPSVGLTLPRHVPKGGKFICGEWFPEGIRVGVNAAVVHRDKTIFGDDADQFNPERWFRDDADNMNRHMLQFGGGSRTCIGKNISLCEMYKIIPQLLISYDLEDVGTEWVTHNYWFNKPSNVKVKVKHRCVDRT